MLSIGPSPSAVHKSERQHQRATRFILWQRNDVDIPSLETTDSLVPASISNTKHTAREVSKELNDSEPSPLPRLSKTPQTKRGGKLLAKEKDSAQFYEVRRIGLDAPRSSDYDTVELKSNAADDGATFPFDTLFSRTLDTIEDVVLHARRIPYDLGWVMEGSHAIDHRKTIVVLGKYSVCEEMISFRLSFPSFSPIGSSI